MHFSLIPLFFHSLYHSMHFSLIPLFSLSLHALLSDPSVLSVLSPSLPSWLCPLLLMVIVSDMLEYPYTNHYTHPACTHTHTHTRTHMHTRTNTHTHTHTHKS